MKTVLILTDFSDNATNAAKSAVTVVEKLKANVIVYNSYFESPILTAYAAGPWVIDDVNFRRDDSIIQLDKLAIQLKHDIRRRTPKGHEPEIELKYGEGSIGNSTAALAQSNQIDFIVMGGCANSALNHLLFGSDTMDVIDHTECPVMVVPPDTELKALKKVTLATAFEPEDINAINYMINLSKVLGFQLIIAHIKIVGKQEDAVKQRVVRGYVENLSHSHIIFREVTGKHVISSLNKMCSENGSDMLALVHYPHGFMSSLFKKCTTEEALSDQPIPLLVLPSDMEGGL